MRESRRSSLEPSPLRTGAAAWPIAAWVVIPFAAVLGMLFEGVPAWMVGCGAAALGAFVAHASAARASSKFPVAMAPPPAVPDSSETVLRNAIELQGAERTLLLNGLTDAVVLVDDHGETRFANRAACEMLGPRAGDAGTRVAVDALPPQVMRAVQGVAGNQMSARRRLECALGKAPAEMPVVVSVASVSDGAHGALVAITVRNVRAEREADRMKSEFVAKVSHELRTPLASIHGCAEMLADGEGASEERRAKLVGMILDGTERLSALVDNMLDISKIEAGMMRPCIEPVDLVDLAEQCVAAQQVLAQQRSITLSVTRRCDGAIVPADRARLVQVFTNFLSNALKYTQHGGTVGVEVDLDNLTRSAVVSVRDNGVGIPEHAMGELWKQFGRVREHEKLAKGTGLGLNLCLNIVENMHGGQVGVESKVDVGSRFWFAIPLEVAGRRAA